MGESKAVTMADATVVEMVELWVDSSGESEVAMLADRTVFEKVGERVGV